MEQLSCTSREQDASTLKTEFYKEAYRQCYEIFDMGGVDVVAACQILSLARACEGDDAQSSTFTTMGVDASERLGLFDAPVNQGSEHHHSPDQQRSRAYAAWGLYSYLR